MGQKETVSKQAKTNVETAGLNIPHTFLVGKIAPNYILGNNYLAKTSAEVDLKAKKLHFHQRG